MDKNLGGRGKKAPYETTHVRIPVPIKERVENLKDLYINGELEQHDKTISENNELADKYRGLMTSNDSQLSPVKNNLIDLDKALLEAKSILKFKQSARKSVVKLLSALYGVQIVEDDLKD
jgi:hypothetical protein